MEPRCKIELYLNSANKKNKLLKSFPFLIYFITFPSKQNILAFNIFLSINETYESCCCCFYFYFKFFKLKKNFYTLET